MTSKEILELCLKEYYNRLPAHYDCFAEIQYVIDNWDEIEIKHSQNLYSEFLEMIYAFDGTERIFDSRHPYDINCGVYDYTLKFKIKDEYYSAEVYYIYSSEEEHDVYDLGFFRCDLETLHKVK